MRNMVLAHECLATECLQAGRSFFALGFDYGRGGDRLFCETSLVRLKPDQTLKGRTPVVGVVWECESEVMVACVGVCPGLAAGMRRRWPSVLDQVHLV